MDARAPARRLGRQARTAGGPRAEEFYAGRALAFEGLANDRAPNIRHRLHDPRYDEPILLALGLVGREQPEQVEHLVAEAIYPAVGRAHPDEALLGWDFLFALRVLGDDIPLQTATMDGLLQQAIDEFLDPASRCRFTRYRKALVERLEALEGTRAAARMISLLGRVANQESTAITESFVELARACAPLGLPAPGTAGALAALATDDKLGPATRSRAAQALGLAGAVTPEVISALVTMATDRTREIADPWAIDNPWTPATAVEVLGQIGAITAEAASTLIAIATSSDTHPDTRIQAAIELSQIGAITPEITSALATIATDDPWDDGLPWYLGGRKTRAEAVAALSQTGATTPEATSPIDDPWDDSPRWRDRDWWKRRPSSRAYEVLEPADAITPEVISALIDIAAGNPRLSMKQPAKHWDYTAPTTRVLTVLLAGIRRNDHSAEEAGQALLAFAQTHPEIVDGFQRPLSGACADPELTIPDGYGARPGWDYIYDALWMVTQRRTSTS